MPVLFTFNKSMSDMNSLSMKPLNSKIECNRDFCGTNGWISCKCCDFHNEEYAKFLSEINLSPPKDFADCSDVGTQT